MLNGSTHYTPQQLGDALNRFFQANGVPLRQTANRTDGRRTAPASDTSAPASGGARFGRAPRTGQPASITGA